MKVVIVGGGFAGVKSALELNNIPGIEVDFICSNTELTYGIPLLGVSMAQNTLQLSISELFDGSSNVRIIHDEVIALNSRVKAVKVGTGDIYRYDRLLLCIGTSMKSFSIPDVDLFAHHAYTPQSKMNLERGLTDLFRIPHRSKVKVIIVGGGTTGVQFAGSLVEFSKIVAQRYAIAPKKVDISLIASSSRVLPEFNDSISQHVQGRLEKLGVVSMLGKEVQGFSRNIVHVGTEELAADIVIWAGGTMVNEFFLKYPELFEIIGSRVMVNDRMQVPHATDIYVLGDSADTKQSGMAESALNHAMRATHTLLAEVGHDSYKLKPHGHSVCVIPVGSKWAVVQVGNKVYVGRSGWLRRRKNAKSIAKNLQVLKKRS